MNRRCHWGLSGLGCLPQRDPARWRSAGQARSASTVVVNRYTFGDDRSALDRLLLVARAYEPVSRTFLTSHAPQYVPTALDLGCGPGFSTQLVNEVCRPRTLVGVDSSGAFLRSARERLPGARFETHDVTASPLPGAPAELIYARLLLAHIADPLRVAQEWTSQLVPGGVLLIEDLEGVINPPGPLREYESVAAQIVRSGGGPMYAGAILGALGGETQNVTVPGAVAAQIYRLNVLRWRETGDHPVPDGQLRDLEQGLVGIAAADQGTLVSWLVRHLVIEG